MSIEAVREKFRWGEDASKVLQLTEEAVASLFSGSAGFRPTSCDLDLDLNSEKGRDLETVMGEACAALLSCGHNSRHPTALAHMVPPPATISVLGDLLKGAANQCAFTWEQAPLAPVVESAVLSWVAATLGFDKQSGGLFTSGGTISNFAAAFVALSRAKQKYGEQERFCIIASDQAHFSVQKAARLIGIDGAGVFLAPTGPDGRLQQDALTTTVKLAVSQGYRPFLFICTGGTTNAGVLEPIDAFTEEAQPYSAWVHLDGAHGAFFALSTAGRNTQDYWRVADSVSWDPHKTLFVSYPAGVLILRDSEHLAPLGVLPDYAFQETAPIDPAFRHIEGSRGFDALKVWLTIRHIGREGFVVLADHLMGLAKYLAAGVRESQEFELITPPDTNIVCFRCVDAAMDSGILDDLNTNVRKELYLNGDVLLSGTKIGDRVVLRAVLQNPFTSKDSVDRLLLVVRDTALRLGLSPQADRACEIDKVVEAYSSCD